MKLKFNQVDVFTSEPFMGNPVAVVFDADDLTEIKMQQIAKWTNLSETTFVQSSEIGDYKLKIFSQRGEMKFAGHPTVGSAYALLKAGKLNSAKKGFMQDCKAGMVIIKAENGKVYTKVPEIYPLNINIDQKLFENAIGCKTTSKPIALDSGPVWVTASVLDLNTLNSIKLDIDRANELNKNDNISGINLYCIDNQKNVHVRTFAPMLGVLEDPVCGSGNAAVAAHAKISGAIKTLGDKFTAYQGSALGRNGVIQIKLEKDDIYIGGESVIVINGEINI